MAWRGGNRLRTECQTSGKERATVRSGEKLSQAGGSRTARATRDTDADTEEAEGIAGPCWRFRTDPGAVSWANSVGFAEMVFKKTVCKKF